MTKKGQWSQKEIDFVLHSKEMMSHEEIGQKIDRSPEAVKQKLRKLSNYPKEVNKSEKEDGKKSTNIREWVISNYKWILTGIFIPLFILVIQEYRSKQTAEDIKAGVNESIRAESRRLELALTERFSKIDPSTSAVPSISEKIHQEAENILKESENDYIKGLAYLSLDNFSKALEYLKRATESYPKNEDAWFFKAQAHYYLGDFEGTILSCQKVSKNNPNYIYCLDGIGISMLSLGGKDNAIKAERAYSELLMLLPKNETELRTKALINSGQSLKIQGRYEDAIESYKRVLAINPRYWHAWENIAVMYLYLRNSSGMKYNALKALELNPSEAKYSLLLVGSALRVEENYTEAVRYFEEFFNQSGFSEEELSYSSSREDSFYLLGLWNYVITLCELGRYDDGIALSDKLVGWSSVYCENNKFDECRIRDLAEVKEECETYKRGYIDVNITFLGLTASNEEAQYSFPAIIHINHTTGEYLMEKHNICFPENLSIYDYRIDYSGALNLSDFLNLSSFEIVG